MVYEAAATRGITPPVADECDMWVLAAALGGNQPDEEADPTIDESGLTFNQRRARAAALGEPMPTWDAVPMSAREIEDQKKLMEWLPPIVPPSG